MQKCKITFLKYSIEPAEKHKVDHHSKFKSNAVVNEGLCINASTVLCPATLSASGDGKFKI